MKRVLSTDSAELEIETDYNNFSDGEIQVRITPNIEGDGYMCFYMDLFQDEVKNLIRILQEIIEDMKQKK